VSGEQGASQIPLRDSDQSHYGHTGEKLDRFDYNASWRLESGGGDTDQPGHDMIRVSAETAEHEKLKDESRASDCQ
jgi:hypothetical protein